ncbi:MAG: hypothetical protein WBM24_18385 [Candidatus Sulfotelmatobacter sp.]
MSYSQTVPIRTLLILLAIVAASAVLSAEKKQPPPPPEHAKSPVPAVTDEYIRKEFGDDCSLLGGPPQFVGDLDGDGVDDLVVAARCKNPIADQAEYGFHVADPYDSFLGFGDVKVTSTFASDAPERKGVCLLIVHGVGPEAWRSDKPKPKFLLINLPFKSLAVKRLALKKRTVLGIYMEERGEGESTSSVLYWDGKKYRYQQIGATFD